jgi:hypothetical protein
MSQLHLGFRKNWGHPSVSRHNSHWGSWIGRCGWKSMECIWIWIWIHTLWIPRVIEYIYGKWAIDSGFNMISLMKMESFHSYCWINREIAKYVKGLRDIVVSELPFADLQRNWTSPFAPTPCPFGCISWKDHEPRDDSAEMEPRNGAVTVCWQTKQQRIEVSAKWVLLPNHLEI